MKISTNAYGNYGMMRPVRDVNNIHKTQQVQTQKTPRVKASGNTITNDERNFFATRYPDNKAEIMDYHYYQKSGKVSGINLGTIFDKRG